MQSSISHQVMRKLRVVVSVKSALPEKSAGGSTPRSPAWATSVLRPSWRCCTPRTAALLPPSQLRRCRLLRCRRPMAGCCCCRRSGRLPRARRPPPLLCRRPCQPFWRPVRPRDRARTPIIRSQRHSKCSRGVSSNKSLPAMFPTTPATPLVLLSAISLRTRQNSGSSGNGTRRSREPG